MKLSNQQIDAIIETQSAKLTKQKADISSKLKDNIKLKKEAKRWAEYIAKIPDNIIPQYNKPKEESILIKLVAEVMAINNINLPTSDLRNKLIIASIDSKDMAELQEKLGITL
jgi:hypothetical protein